MLLSPSTFHSTDDSELVEVVLPSWSSCIGVRVVCWFAVSDGQRCWQRASSGVRRWLWVAWCVGEWIKLELPSAAVDGELRFKVGGARGASPADVSSTTESTQRQRRATTAAQQSSYAMGFLQIWAAAGALNAREGRQWWFSNELGGQKLSGVPVFSRGFCACSIGQLSLFPVSTYLYVSVFMYVFLK